MGIEASDEEDSVVDLDLENKEKLDNNEIGGQMLIPS